MGQARRITGDHDGAITAGQQALDLAAALGDSALQVQAAYLLGETYICYRRLRPGGRAVTVEYGGGGPRVWDVQYRHAESSPGRD